MSLLDALAKMARRFDEIESLIGDSEVVSDPNRLRSLLKERGALRERVEMFRRYEKTRTELDAARSMAVGLTDPDEMALFATEIDELEDRLARNESSLRELFVTDDEDSNRDVILEIRAGTGGDEAALFAGDLFQMYLHYAEGRRWSVEILDSSEGAAGGFKEIIAEINGESVYKLLRFESGGHRVQRVPATETQGRIHTSAATVAVLPQIDEVELQIAENDLRIDTYRSSGPGGQKVNKTSSAIRITHLPTGLVVTCQDEKSQHKNRSKAMRILSSRLYEMEVQRRHQERASTRKALIGSGDRNQRIRTYNFPQNRITDHRIGLTVHSLDRVLAGDLDELIEPAIAFDREQRLQNLDRQEN